MSRGQAAHLDRLAAELVTLTDDEIAALLDECAPHELELIDLAVSRQNPEPWRATPATFASHLDPDHFVAWRYVEILAETVRQLVEAEITRAIVMLPARYGKTTITSVWGSAWALDRYPWLKVVLASYGHELAVANSLAVRDILDAHAAQLRVKVRRNKRTAKHWLTTDGGMLRAVGVGSGLTGHGGDLIIIDDPFKDWQAAHSPTIRDTVWNWYKSVIRTRLQTERSAIMLVGTRWHEDDLAGRLLAPPDDSEKEDWVVVRMPALAEDPQENAHGKAWEKLPDPLGRAPGEPLEPSRFPLDAVIARMKSLGSYLSAGMEQQRPSSLEGGILKRVWWKHYGPRPDEYTADDALISWDSSFDDTTTKSSFCVGQYWLRIGAHRYLIDQVRGQMDYPTFRNTVTSFSRKWPRATKVLIEKKANGAAVIKDLYGIVPGLLPREPKGSKESRANACAGLIEAGNVWLPDPGLDPDVLGGDYQVDRSFVHDFIEECALFPGGSFDDQVDSMTQALIEWQNAEIPDTGSYARQAGGSRR